MMSQATPASPAPRRRALDRAAAAFVLVLLALGSLALWTGVPLATAWAISKLTESSSTHFVATLIGIPVAMVLFAPALFWLNGLYLRIRAGGASQAEDEWDEEEWEAGAEEPPVVPRGPIEPLLLVSFVLAVIALAVWFFIFADNPELAAF